jgi:hypothetical protein
MPDSFGKRNRAKVRERKAEVREERRIARLQRRKGLTPVTGDEEPTPIDDAGAVPAESVEEALTEPTARRDPIQDETATA